MKNNIIDRGELIDLIRSAKTRVRVLGAVAFDLPISDLQDLWYEKINAGTLTVEIISESESTFNYDALISSDIRASGESRIYEVGSFIKIAACGQKLKTYLEHKGCRHLEPEKDVVKSFLDDLEEKSKNEQGAVSKEEYETIKEQIKNGEYDLSQFEQCLFIKTYYKPIPIPTINIDDEYYIGFALTKFNHLEKFERITSQHVWAEEFSKYFTAYFDAPRGAKKYATEMTKKGNLAEVIQMYTEKRAPLGQLPRDSFLEAPCVKVVIWALMFTRDGRMLIHQRSKNAKDNQGMWDKSVGGHVALEDIDTVKAAAREIIEELRTIEEAEQGSHGNQDFFTVNEDKMIYLGEWRPEYRDTMPFENVKNKRNEYYYFRMDYDLSRKHHNSPRHLPNGKVQRVKAFADLYVCIAEENFDIGELKNSKYMLIEPHQLKAFFNEGEYVNREGITEEFKVTPDLENILTSELWSTEIAPFAEYVKENLSKK